MNSGAFREKITIQKKSITEDKIGLQSELWEDFFVCRAYVNNLSGREFWAAVQENAEKTVEFLMRYSRKLSEINTVGYRIIFRKKIYDIVFIDNIQYGNKLLKLRAMVRDCDEYEP